MVIILLGVVVVELGLIILLSMIGMCILYRKKSKASSTATAVPAEPIIEAVTGAAVADPMYEMIRDNAVSHFALTSGQGVNGFQQHSENVMTQNSAYCFGR